MEQKDNEIAELKAQLEQKQAHMDELEGKIQILLNNINQLQEELGKLQPALAEDNLQQKYE